MSTDSFISGHVDDWAETAVEYVDGHLDDQTRSAVQAHLDACPDCAARLAAQQNALAVFSANALADPPTGLEAQVLEQVFDRAKPAQTRSIFGRRRGQGQGSRPRALPAGPWLPALAGSAAVVALVLALTLTNGTGPLDEDGTSPAVAFSDGTTLQTTADGAAMEPSTTAREQMAVNVTAGVDGSDTTTAASTAVSVASLQPVAPFVQDEELMVGELAQASTPAYFFFDTPEGDQVTAAQADTLATQFASLTSLQRMDESLSSGVRAFAAFVPRKDSSAIVDLLFSMGDSMGLAVCMSLEPGAEVTEWADTMLKDKYSIAELTASRVAPTGWRFTTSTATPTTQGTTVTTKPALLTESDSHVLVVIFMAVER